VWRGVTKQQQQQKSLPKTYSQGENTVTHFMIMIRKCPNMSANLVESSFFYGYTALISLWTSRDQTHHTHSHTHTHSQFICHVNCAPFQIGQEQKQNTQQEKSVQIIIIRTIIIISNNPTKLRPSSCHSQRDVNFTTANAKSNNNSNTKYNSQVKINWKKRTHKKSEKSLQTHLNGRALISEHLRYRCDNRFRLVRVSYEYP